MASLSLRSGCACTQQEVNRTRQSPIPMEVELHKKPATGQNISSLSSLELKGVMAKQWPPVGAKGIHVIEETLSL